MATYTITVVIGHDPRTTTIKQLTDWIKAVSDAGKIRRDHIDFVGREIRIHFTSWANPRTGQKVIAELKPDWAKALHVG